MLVEKLIADHLKVDVSNVTDDKHIIDDLGADSLDTVELVMALEEEFELEIADDDADSLVTVGAIKQYIEDNS